MSSLHQTAEYARWRKLVMLHCEPICIRCGYEVDMTLSGRNPMGPSADHEPPLAVTGDISPGLDGSGISHTKCNRQHGGKIGAQRSSASRRGTSSNRSDRQRRMATCLGCGTVYPPNRKSQGKYCTYECFQANRPAPPAWTIEWTYNCVVCNAQCTHNTTTKTDPQAEEPTLKRVTCDNQDCKAALPAIQVRDRYRKENPTALDNSKRKSKYPEMKNRNEKYKIIPETQDESKFLIKERITDRKSVV